MKLSEHTSVGFRFISERLSSSVCGTKYILQLHLGLLDSKQAKRTMEQVVWQAFFRPLRTQRSPHCQTACGFVFLVVWA